MKKLLLGVSLLLIFILVIALYRAHYHYSDRQYHPDKEVTRISVDKAAVSKRLSRAIQISTISQDEPPHVEPESFIKFHQLLENQFPEIARFANRYIINDYSLVYEFPGTQKALNPILFMGHIDVVPVDSDTLSAWTHPPFAGQIADGQIWGRGAIDDKATVMALMEAIELQLKNGNQPNRTVYFAFGHDEEIGGSDGAAKSAAFFQERGIRFDMVLDEGGAIVEDIVKGFDQPVAMIGIAEKGFVNIRMTVQGEGGHSSMPPDSTAAGILAQAIVNLEAKPFASSLQFTNLVFDAIGHYAEFNTRLTMANQWLLAPVIENVLLQQASSAASLRTTTAVTMLTGSSKSNILPTQASAVANFRIFPGESVDSVLAHVSQAIDDPRVQLEVFMATNPSPVSPVDSQEFKMLEQTIREFQPNTLVAPYLVQGGTDAKYFYGLSDSVYRFLMIKINPETLSSFHGINERINQDDYVMSIQYFYELFNKVSFDLPPE